MRTLPRLALVIGLAAFAFGSDERTAAPAQEKLTLAAPVPGPTTTEWTIEDIYLSKTAPAIKATLVSNAGDRFVYRYVPSATVTAAQVNAAITYINQGRFKTVDNQTLQAWILSQISAQGVKVGTVSGGL